MKIMILGNQGRAVANFWTVLAQTAMQAGHEIVFCVPPGDAEADWELRRLNARVCHYPLQRKGLKPSQDFATFSELKRLLRHEKPDLLFTSTIKPVIYGCLAAKSVGISHIYATITGLGYVFEADTFLKKLLRFLCIGLYKVALRAIDGIFFQNADDPKVFARFHILHKTDRVLHANGTGVDLAHFALAPLPTLPPKGTLTFIFIGRLIQAKGVQDYKQAAQVLKKIYGQAVRFLLLGPIEQGVGCLQLQDLHIGAKDNPLEYLGQTTDVRPFLAQSHVLVLPSWREGLPTVVMEAMAVGRATIVTDVPGCRDLVQHNKTGKIIPVRNPNALIEAMRFFLQNPYALVHYGAEARLLAEKHYDARHVAEQILIAMRVPHG